MSAPEKTVPSNVMLPDDEHNQRLINYVHPPHWVNPTPTGQYNLVVIGGGTAGLVTLNDLVSRIVGELSDNAESMPDIQPHADGSAMLNGLTTIGDVNEAFGLVLQDSNYDTIGGYIMGQLGRVARVGDVVNPSGASISFKDEEMDKLRVARVKLIRN